MSALVVGVTGASGYIGRAVMGRLESAGLTPVALVRNPKVPAERRLVLGESIAPESLSGLDALVHCAWDMAATTVPDVYARNVVGTTQLLAAANQAGVKRFVTISSMSAYAGTRQVYGRAKLDCERATTELGGASLRLGLVWADRPEGMAGAVGRLASLPVLPLLGMRSHQFTVHLDDAREAVLRAVVDPTLVGVYGVAHPVAVPIPALFPRLAQLSGGVPGRPVPVPWRPLYAAMRLAEGARVALPLRSDSVLGLVRPASEVPGVEAWAERGVSLRAFGSGLIT